MWGLDAEGVPAEKMQMGMVIAERKGVGTAFYKAKYYVENLMNGLNISVDFRELETKNPMALPFEKKRAAEIAVNDETIGVVGEFKNSVKRAFKLGDFLAGFELDFEKLVEYTNPTKKIDVRPVVDKRDLTIETDKTYGEIIASVRKVLDKNGVDAEISPLAIYQPENIKHVSIHLDFKQKIDNELMQELEKVK